MPASRSAPDPSPNQGLSFPWPEPPAPGEVVRVRDGLLWFRLPLPYRLDHVNIYLLADGDGWAAVDTGLGDAVSREAWLAVLDGALAGSRLTRLIVTHFHPDHVGLAGWLAERFGLPLHMPAVTTSIPWRCRMPRSMPAARSTARSTGATGCRTP